MMITTFILFQNVSKLTNFIKNVSHEPESNTQSTSLEVFPYMAQIKAPYSGFPLHQRQTEIVYQLFH